MNRGTPFAPPIRVAGLAVLSVAVLTACAEPTGVGLSDLVTPPTAFSHGDFTESSGIYRIPYADGRVVKVTRDHHDHTPPDRIDMAGVEAGYEIVAAASGTIRAIVDRHGNAPNAGDGLSADGSQAQDDALEHSCTDDATVIGSCSDYNNYVWIEHPNGEWTKYSHFGTGTVAANGWAVGDWIEAGDTLGLEGDVGAASGPHLHYEVGIPTDAEDETPFTELGGFMVPDFGVNVVPLSCLGDEIGALYVTDTEYTAAACVHEPPTADAGGPYEVGEGMPLMLDGSASADPEERPLTYAWTPEEYLDDPSAVQPMFLGADDAVVDVTLTVYDQVEALHDMAETQVTVLNVAPTVSISGDQVTEIMEGETLEVMADFMDPGVLDAPFTAQVQCYDVTGYSLSVEGTVEITSEDGPLTGTVTASCPYGDTSQSGEPPAGTFTVTVSVTDKDGGTGADSFELTVVNVDPTADIDMSGATTVAGGPTFLTTVGEMVDMSAQVMDPGSDDLFTTWDWADGSMDQAASLVDDPNHDPFPSPTVDPRDIVAAASHAWMSPCLYQVVLTADDDDAGQGMDTAMVVVTGDAKGPRGAGYWMVHYRGQIDHIDAETLACYQDIVGHMSAVFDEVTDGTSVFAETTDVLWTNDSRGDMIQLMERTLMAAWLNFAHGAFAWDQMMDTDGDGEADTPFSEVMETAEAVRLDPESTRQDLAAQKAILGMLNGND